MKIWHDYRGLKYPERGSAVRHPFRIILKQFPFCKIHNPKNDKRLLVIEMEGVPKWGHILAIGLGYNIINGQGQHQIKERITGYIKKPHTAIFIGQTRCGKTHLVLELVEKEYSKHFDYIIIICPRLRENNKTYHARR